MKTNIKEIHTESFSDGSRTLGILFNYSNEDNNFKESLVYAFRNTEEGGIYVFYETMFDMWTFLLHGDNKMKRAYMRENEFDEIFDAPYIEGRFSEKLIWC